MGEWWATNWEKVLTVASLVVGLFGLIGIWIGWKSWRLKKPVYVIRSVNLFSDLGTIVPDVSVSFAGYGGAIKALTVTKIALWNAGNETISKQDMVKEDALCIKAAEGVIILSAAIVQCSTEFNKFDCTVNRERTKAAIGFDYMDNQQGVVIQVFHTGTSSKDLTIEGTFKGIKKIVRRVLHPRQPDPRPKPMSRPKALLTLGVLWGVIFLGSLALILAPQSNAPHPAVLEPQPPMTKIEFLQVVWTTVGIFTILLVYFIYVTTVPRSLSKFNSDN